MLSQRNIKTIGVFFGSRNPEHDISIITGQLIISGLKGNGHNVIPVYLTKDGEWLIGEELGSLETFRKKGVVERLTKEREYVIDLKKSNGNMTFKRNGLSKKEIQIDIAFPAIHGEYGEDGTIQGLFEMFDIPYVGCGVTSSAIAMDKVLTKQLYQHHNIPTPDFIYFTKEDWAAHKDDILSKAENTLGTPVFVKPARLGSSIAITKANSREEIERAIDVALHYETKALVESAIEDMKDITCAVIEENGKPRPSLLQDSSYKEGFFSYEDKYLEGGGAQLGKAESNLQIPADLDKHTTQEIQNMAVDVFKKIECAGIARVDFLYDEKNKKIYVNEINTLPGTLYHHLWEKSGIPLDNLLDILLKSALTRHHEKEKIARTFSSSVLSQNSSGAKTPKFGEKELSKWV
jgi:D-alanine-D-alanine ligase